MPLRPLEPGRSSAPPRGQTRRNGLPEYGARRIRLARASSYAALGEIGAFSEETDAGSRSGSVSQETPGKLARAGVDRRLSTGAERSGPRFGSARRVDLDRPGHGS